MKRLVGLFISCFLVSAVFAQTSVSAPGVDEVLNKAYTQAKKENKKVLLMFHASWCGWCHKMDTSLNDPACKKFFADNYVITHLVIDEYGDKKILENPGVYEFRKKYHGEGSGIPFWLVFDAQGKLLADSKIRSGSDGPDGGSNIGCPAREDEVNYFIQVLKKTSKLTDEQLAIIHKRFRENER